MPVAVTAKRRQTAARKAPERPEAAAEPRESDKQSAPAIPVLEDVFELAAPETGPEKEQAQEPEMPPLPLSTLDDAQLHAIMQNLSYKLERQIASLATVVRINFMRELREQFEAIVQKRSETQEADEASADKTIPPGSAPADGAGRKEPQ